MKLPTFVGIGVYRSGTRWLSQCLAEHPEIHMLPYEADFFDTSYLLTNWRKGIKWYSGLFESCTKPGVKQWGEITPNYFRDEDSLLLLYRYLPQARLICILREQSEWLNSYYKLFIHFNPYIYKTDFSFKTFLTYNPGVLRDGFYIRHLQKYLKLYPRESMLILLYDDLKKEPEALIKQVYTFLEVDDTFVPPSLNVRINPTLLELFRSRLLKKASIKLTGIPFLGRVKELIDVFNDYQLDSGDFAERHRMTGDVKEIITSMYREDNEKLGEFLKRDLSHWNK